MEVFESREYLYGDPGGDLERKFHVFFADAAEKFIERDAAHELHDDDMASIDDVAVPGMEYVRVFEPEADGGFVVEEAHEIGIVVAGRQDALEGDEFVYALRDLPDREPGLGHAAHADSFEQAVWSKSTCQLVAHYSP